MMLLKTFDDACIETKVVYSLYDKNCDTSYLGQVRVDYLDPDPETRGRGLMQKLALIAHKARVQFFSVNHITGVLEADVLIDPDDLEDIVTAGYEEKMVLPWNCAPV